MAQVAKCPQYLQHVAKSSIRLISCNIVPAILSQNLPLATRATFWCHNPCNIRKKCCVASASKNVPRAAAALEPLQSIIVKQALFHVVVKLQVLPQTFLCFCFSENSKTLAIDCKHHLHILTCKRIAKSQAIV